MRVMVMMVTMEVMDGVGGLKLEPLRWRAQESPPNAEVR
jgi:hypothetical protein